MEWEHMWLALWESIFYSFGQFAHDVMDGDVANGGFKMMS